MSREPRKTLSSPEQQVVLTASSGTDLFDVILDSKTVHNHATDPADSISNAESIVIRVPEGATHLQVFHEYEGAAPTIHPVVRAFGHTSLDNDKSDPDWIPLRDMTNILAFSYTPTLSQAGSGASGTSPSLNGDGMFRLVGCKEIIVTLPTASDPGGVGKIVGRFISAPMV